MNSFCLIEVFQFINSCLRSIGILSVVITMWADELRQKKSYRLKRGFIFLVFYFLFISISTAQVIGDGESPCSPNGGHQYPTTVFSTTSSSWTTVSSAINGGNWTLFNVTPCNTYEWSYCSDFGGSEAWDAEVSLYNYTSGSIGAELGHQDNSGRSNCPSAPYIAWTCPSGITKVLLYTTVVTSQRCQTNSGSPYSTLVWRQSAVGSAPPTPTGIVGGGVSVCPSTTATVDLGALGQNPATLGGRWAWYSGSCGGNLVGSGPDYYVNISQPGSYTYYLRSETSCGNSICLNTTVTVVSAPATPVPTASPNPVCQGQAFTLNANASGNSYEWSGPNSYSSHSQNPLVATTQYGSGNYCLIYDGANCESQQGCVSVTVQQVPTVYITPGGNVSLCSTGANSSAQLTANGAATYIWSPASGLSSTTGTTVTVSNLSSSQAYIVTGTDIYGCSASNSVNVNVTTTPNINIAPPTSSICEGKSENLQATGSAQNYSWSPSTGLSSTTGQTVTSTPNSTVAYTVTASNGNCSATASTTITVNSPPVASISSSASIISEGGSVTITAIGGTSYTWSNGQTVNPITVSPDTATVYTVTVTDINGCSATAETTINVTVTSVPEIQDVHSIRISPNPNMGECTLTFEVIRPHDVEINILKASGQLVMHEKIGNVKGVVSKHISLSTQAPGVYLLQIKVDTQTIEKKIILISQ